MGRSKKAVKARSKRRRELKKHHRKQEKFTDGAVKYDGCTDEQHIDETSTVESDDKDHSNMETDPLFKDFKKYIKAKHQLERAKEKVTQCCGRKVVKTEDGQVKIVFLDYEYNF